MSHTSSLAGADTLYDALFERYGIARVTSVTAFVETLKFLHHGGPLADSRLVSMSCSGGEAALVADMALEKSVSFPPFDAATKPKVAATLNEYVSIDNPLDYHTFIWRQEDKLTATFAAVLAGGFDVGMLILDVPTQPQMNPDAWLATARALHKAANGDRGARRRRRLACPNACRSILAEELAACGVAPMMGLDDALDGLRGGGRHRAQLGARSTRCRSWRRPCGAAGRDRTLTEFEAKSLLKGFGLGVPEGRSAQPAKLSAAADADRLSRDAQGLVAGHCAQDRGGRRGAQSARPRGGCAAADAHRQSWRPTLLVERMVTGAVAELIIGLKADPQFGLALVVGAGGILTELLKDSVTLLLPTDRGEIERALRSLKVWKLDRGLRGKSGDQAAVIDAVEAIARFAKAHRRARSRSSTSIPCSFLPDGAVAVDALIRMRTP